MQINLKLLRELRTENNASFYSEVLRELDEKDKGSDVVEIKSCSKYLWNRLEALGKLRPDIISLAPMLKETPIKEQMQQAIEADKKRRQREKDQQAGFARLQQYVDEQGLANTEENGLLVQKFLDEKVKGYWSAAGVDAAIDSLGRKGLNVLKWSPKPVAPAPPAPPPEPVELLSDGSPRLPIDTVPARHHTKAQLRDLDQRQRAARGGQHRGQIRWGSTL